MDDLVPIITAKENGSPVLPSSARNAILLPSIRFDAYSQSIIGSLVGVANEETVILLSDNSEDAEKKLFLERIRKINPNIFAVQHEKNIGGHENFEYVFKWSKGMTLTAVMADDDWISPDYHLSAFRYLEETPSAPGAAVGNTIVLEGEPRIRATDGTQPQMVGETPIERMRKWNAIAPRVTMYNASRRHTLVNAVQFVQRTPLFGVCLLEDLWETSRLAFGSFVTKPGGGFLVHNPASTPNWEVIYQRFHGGSALPFSYVYFSSLGTAIQLGIFLKGTLSPLDSKADKSECADYIFDHIFKNHFLTTVGGNEKAARSQFSNHPNVVDGFLRYCMPPYTDKIPFDKDILSWYISILDALEKKPQNNEASLSEKFEQFASELLPDFQLEAS